MDKIEPKFLVGDVVQWNSGGPEMTVASLEMNLNPETVQHDIFTGFNNLPVVSYRSSRNERTKI